MAHKHIGTVFEGETVVVQSLVRKRDGTLLVASDVSEWSLNVYDESGGEALAFNSQGVGGAAIISAPQPWTVDKIGYNFQGVVLPQSYAQAGAHTYLFEWEIVLVGGELFELPVRVYVEPIRHLTEA